MAYPNRRKTTPIDFSGALLGSVGIGLGVYFFLLGLDGESDTAFPGMVMIVLFSVLAALNFVHYSFTEKYLIVRFLGIPIRKIYWRSVSHAVYAKRWRINGGKVKYKFGASSAKADTIFVSLHGCPPYDPQRDAFSDFSMIHGKNFLSISLPAKTAAEYVEVFRACFPDLTVQMEEAER